MVKKNKFANPEVSGSIPLSATIKIFRVDIKYYKKF